MKYVRLVVCKMSSTHGSYKIILLRVSIFSIINNVTILRCLLFQVWSILVILHTQLRTALLNMRYGSDSFIQGRVVSKRFQVQLKNPIKIPCLSLCA